MSLRKVLGARTRDIVRLLVWQFSRPVIVANLVAWPVGWSGDAGLAQCFRPTHRTPVPFASTALFALGIAVVTVTGHAVKVARENSIHALRHE